MERGSPVRLPRPEIEAERQNMQRANNIVVLCFDDILADLLGQILRENDYDVQHARTLADALSELRVQAANLIIVDVDRWRDQETGLLLDALGSDQTAHDTPVLVLAHATDASSARNLLPLYPNVRALITKPFDLDTLERETRKLLG
jgi:DNA-binding NtrC family response regulator